MIRDSRTRCVICPRLCGVNRQRDERGFCRAGSGVTIAETSVTDASQEKLLRGDGRTAQLFFSRCTLRCVFCSNYGISLQGYGERRSEEELAAELDSLGGRGVSAAFFVTPDQHLPWIADVVAQWRRRAPGIGAFCVTSGYLNHEIVDEMMALFDTIIVSLKPIAERDSQALVGRADYWRSASLVLEKAAAERPGRRFPPCIVRIVVLPGRPDIVRGQLESLASVVPLKTPINFVDFRPSYLWGEYGEWRRNNAEERSAALEYAHETGFESIIE